MTLDELEAWAKQDEDVRNDNCCAAELTDVAEVSLALLAAIRAADAMRDTTLPGTSDRHYAACLDYDAKRREVEA